MPVLDELTLKNRALRRVGASALGAVDEDTTRAEQVEAIWQDVVETCLSLHEWSFGKKTYALALRVAPPENGWLYGYDYPGGVLGGPQAVLRSITREEDILREFTIEENILFANVGAVWATFRTTVAIGIWPPEFRLAVITAVASHLAVPVAGDEKLAKSLGIQAFGQDEEGMRGGLIGSAIALDRAKRPLGSPLLRSDPLTQARYA